MADPSPNLSPTPQTLLPRSYRRNNWTAQETQTLITSIRLNDERRSIAALPSHRVTRLAERCWMWVENYCYARGCRRSQKQCNDKWDNLIRCYRKVHEYQSHSARTEPGSGNWKSYWDMEGHEKKELNLRTNMEFDIYQGITNILNLRNARQNTVPSTPITMIPPPPPQQPPMDLSPPLAVTQAATQTEDPETELEESEEDEPEMKRSKIRDLGKSVVRTASMLSRALMRCEEKNEQRHKEFMGLEERRLRLEERKLRLEEMKLRLEQEKLELNKQAV